MKLLILSVVAALGLLGTTSLRSQTPAIPRDSQQALQAIKAQNQKLLEQQAATLQKLEEMQKTANQLRIFARRS